MAPGHDEWVAGLMADVHPAGGMAAVTAHAVWLSADEEMAIQVEHILQPVCQEAVLRLAVVHRTCPRQNANGTAVQCHFCCLLRGEE